MSNDRDDDALSWAGDDDPTLVSKTRDAAAAPVAPGTAGPPAEPAAGSRLEGRIAEGPAVEESGVGESAVGDSDVEDREVEDSGFEAPDVEGSAPDADDDLPPQTSSVLLVTLGVLGGVYLLFTIGWAVAVQRLAGVFVFSDAVAQGMFVLGEWLAMAAPVVWFFVTIWLTRDSVRARVLWLLLGVPLLAPWPFILGLGAV
ncbi:DNA polymerase III subunit gamma/tau [Compostimonas suwonensis]|uniref:DNA polymerase III subunit gamma/tau n=1 Tax=Compostimonas suwonensis TaxID=1048394 RepID=UPI0012FD5517|nr:DNA polymerase III subunit gamma/tau [Compostimonas suwonensis]